MRRDREVHWTLNGKVPEACGDWRRWAMWFETADRRVAETFLADNAIRISTVFMGLDHRFFGNGPPLLFETMIFGGEHADLMQRYSTWDQAEQGHINAVAIATAAIEKSNVVAGLLAGVVIAALKECR